MLKRIWILAIAVTVALAAAQGVGLNHACAEKNWQDRLKIRKAGLNTYGFKSLSGDLIEIGEEKHSPRQPYLKLNKWDGEVRFEG